MVADKGKRILIHLSSSSSDDDDDDDYDVEDGSCSASASISSGEEWQSVVGEDDDGDVYEVDESEEADEVDEDEDSSDNGRQRAPDDDDDDDDDSLSNRVIQFLQERKDLHDLSLKACKAYLRKHGLRVSGNKEVCVQRAQEHWRIKDGNAEVLYPRSSFVIDCTGDVCKGDIVHFTQKIYGSFNKVTRSGELLGKRTVAGRVVKESYGAAKQQHTFTVEVLWSKGLKKLPPLYALLVKGRNLYRLKTYRQPWKNEAARRKVLAEKHRRGTVARMKRAKRKKVRSTCEGKNSQKVSHSTRQSQVDYSRRGTCDNRASSSKPSDSKFDYQHPDGKQGAHVQTIKAKSSKPLPRHQKLTVSEGRASMLSYHNPSHQYPEPLVGSHHRSLFQNEVPYYRPVIESAAQYSGFSCRPLLHDSYGIGPQRMNPANSGKFFPGQRQNGLFKCSIRGCNECGSDRCVIAACWRCCRREGIRCNVHR